MISVLFLFFSRFWGKDKHVMKVETRELAFSAAHINLSARSFRRTEEMRKRETKKRKREDLQERHDKTIKPNLMDKNNHTKKCKGS
jgi:hypothetical protein